MSSATSSSPAADAGGPPWAALLAPLGSAALAGFDAGAIGFVLPAMRSATGAGAQLASWLLSAFVAATLVAVPVAAILARRRPAARLLRGCLMLAAAAGAAAAAAPGIEPVLLARVLQGLAHGPLLPLAAAVLVTRAPALRHGRVLGLLSLAYGLAYLAAMVGTPFLLAWGWRAAFALCAVLALASALLPLPAPAMPSAHAAPAASVGSAPPADTSAKGLAGTHPQAPGPSPPAAPVWRLFVGRPMRAIAALALGTGLGQAVLVWLPTLAILRIGLSPQASVWPMLALVAGGLSATALVTWRLDRLGARPLVAAGAALAMAGLGLAAAAPASGLVFAAAAAALGFGVTALCGGPLRYAAARALPLSEQGPAQGAVAWLTNLGVLAGSLLLGAVAGSGAGGGPAAAQAVLVVGALMAVSFLAVPALPGPGRPAGTTQTDRPPR